MLQPGQNTDTTGRGRTQQFPPSVIENILRRYQDKHAIDRIGREIEVSKSSVRMILIREGALIPKKRKVTSRTVAEADEWIRRLRTIKDISMRRWVGSILYWDFLDTREVGLFKGLADDYNFAHALTEGGLLNALKGIGYPNPERRIFGKHKGGHEGGVIAEEESSVE